MKKQFITRVFLSSLVLALTSLFGGGNLLAQTVDRLTADMFPATGTTYVDFSGKTAPSGADYAGNSATSYEAIQLRSKNNNSGIVTTTSGGKVTKIVLEWNTNTKSGRTIDVYGKKLAYNSAEDLYSSSSATQGTLIGSITCGTSTTLEITGDYEYIGLRSNKDPLYLNSVAITWASSGGSTDHLLSYDVSVCNATIGQDNTFPVLTFADGVTDTDITYSSSKETVATVDTDGNVTLKGAGETTITASFPGNATLKADKASYTLIVSKPSANLTYSASSCHVVIGEDYTLPTLTYTEGVTGIVFDSSNGSVATVDAEGVVTLTGSVGTTTITASLTGDATYADGSASYELTVKKPNVFVYKKVTSAEDLIKGATYVFVCEGTNKVGTAVSDKKMQPTNATLTDGILEESVDEPMEFVLDIKDGKYCFISGGKYLKGADGTDLTMVSYSTIDEAIKWNILFDEVKGALIWNTYGANNGTGRRLMYRSSKDYNVFGHYAGKIGTEYYNVQLYQKVYPLTVSSATSGYATFYNEEEAYQMPVGLTGYAVTKAENGDCITRKTAYEAGKTVPAKTPLLIIGTTDGGNYYPAVVSGTGVEAYPGSNLLEGARDANGNTHSANDGSVYYYKLGLNAEKPLGFYWGAEGGAAFKMQKATTAYLAVPKTMANGANALFFDFGPETGINEIQTEQADKAIFDLSGRRVQKATKGFYIVGGKKVLVK